MYLSCLRKQEINSPKEVFAQAPFNLPLAICSFQKQNQSLQHATAKQS